MAKRKGATVSEPSAEASVSIEDAVEIAIAEELPAAVAPDGDAYNEVPVESIVGDYPERPYSEAVTSEHAALLAAAEAGELP